jgi:two-component system, sensor histidine kinase and response regulator
MAQRVLVVDGEVEGLARIQAHLQTQGYAFTWALTAVEALETISHEEPDVVIVDGGLADRSAIELVITLRKGEGARHIPVLVAIRKGDEEQRARARRAGADEVLEKPFETNVLSVCVRHLIRLKAVRKELELRRRELAGVYDSQRAFIEALVHDFKNPIAVVHVNLAWLGDRIGPEQTDLFESISDAQEGIGRVQKMVDDLLMVGMLEQSAFPLKREFIRVTELLDQAIKSHAKEAFARKVSLSVSLHEPVGVVGDPVVLRRVLNNMIEASLRHTPSSGRIELSARSGDSVEIAISNTGRPLDAEEKAQLLDKSPPSSGTHRIASGGLGLYLCRRGVEAHDGELDLVESEEWPTSVILRLPATGS